MSNALSRRNVGPPLLPGRLADKAHRAYLRRYLADIPDAEEFAFTLGERELIGLRTAWQTRAGWRVERGFIADLQRIGLCEACGPFLSNFGVAVRRVVGRDAE